ncbi:MAG: NAD(P)H-dependent oxidoreductase, partial [Thermoleophilia bacterium]|nr:NAD(P)H-dependent oxidoreductase [Thermoleophilia bacterium]
MLRVIAIAGSLRRGSHNRRLIDEAARLAPPGVTVEVWEGLRDLPHFDQDLEDDPPEQVARLRDALRGADALLVATPEYNSSLPGALKNALDWASRPPGASALRGLPVAVVSASTGRFGAVWAAQEA